MSAAPLQLVSVGEVMTEDVHFVKLRRVNRICPHPVTSPVFKEPGGVLLLVLLLLLLLLLVVLVVVVVEVLLLVVVVVV